MIHSPLKLIKRYGTSYYLACLRFPRAKREEVFELYKFVRLPDQIIDTPGVNKQQALQQLEQERNQRQTVYTQKNTTDEKYGKVCLLFYTYDIPFEYSQLFRDAMKQDCTKTQYQTYQELQEYMIGSAEVVGLMMNKLLGCPPEADPYARLLGEAMQLTNFLRDVKEDYVDLGRIYIPADILRYHNLTGHDIANMSTSNTIDKRRKAVMKNLINKADTLYRDSAQGHRLIPRQYRVAIQLASVLYQGILRKIERKHYNVFLHTCKTTKREKITMIMSFLIKGKP